MTEGVGHRGTEGAHHDEPGTVELPWILAILLRDRFFIAKFAAVGFSIALALALTRTTLYSSTFSFVPQTGDDQTRAGLASLAGQFGISVGNAGSSSQPPQLYADLLVTRGILTSIAKESVTVASSGSGRIPLPDFLRIKGSDSSIVLEHTLAALRKDVISSSVAARTTGVVTVTVRTHSPSVSLEIAQRLIESLNRFNVDMRRSNASEERVFTEGRLADARASCSERLRTGCNSFCRPIASTSTGHPAGSPELTFQKERLEREVGLQQQKSLPGWRSNMRTSASERCGIHPS